MPIMVIDSDWVETPLTCPNCGPDAVTNDLRGAVNLAIAKYDRLTAYEKAAYAASEE